MAKAKTYIPKKKDIKQKWFLVDANGRVLGRLATRIASILRGKHKTIFTPNMDTGDGVIVINAEKIIVTGKKLKVKEYKRFSGYPGGLHTRTLEEMLKTKPEEVIMHAVKGMLPKGPLGRNTIKKLKVYAGDKHEHAAQKPEILKLEE
ncbi:MAG: 50S ribosomal protein L13 [Candidatus Omnitrophica bacterium CG12_big_fil_rev_8_21_14_0_65_43_15]|uniref:Large ribosomal subunit protein uL13 n=1 Tax=Candidatus Taenaricola geysiri TaxID=1974752 RepID=A0A2J0LE96_9BACT|nr:MAG: 50S ribosomal protein L13 [Candidatus Omnitrophica bacterium CG1_02_43_210]PIR65434.1 MAG: 50S ribosomal protein L13 [Candidatus Omnitrophica bacterium CG10_big_fil_rev_8_21_14_0_10_43_8]PIV12512.1 MAG: 50S ribosomal protein L13 [Candidatus Omnitrophica bacterium CG03_land_8_20_14_0_80_43_22]PIW66171.1 MAG: 50S ribosomal protein L13 [Candidatus Omnitrophica bacterium CG12_big_fil_rev_8_21_14_0_65_43_15]PIW80230.1 MAG: 50S ribosomal protein L13 [Candidatus Omnitrophica bacterium CG_4_8_1